MIYYSFNKSYMSNNESGTYINQVVSSMIANNMMRFTDSSSLTLKSTLSFILLLVMIDMKPIFVEWIKESQPIVTKNSIGVFMYIWNIFGSLFGRTFFKLYNQLHRKRIETDNNETIPIPLELQYGTIKFNLPLSNDLLSVLIHNINNNPNTQYSISDSFNSTFKDIKTLCHTINLKELYIVVDGMTIHLMNSTFINVQILSDENHADYYDLIDNDIHNDTDITDNNSDNTDISDNNTDNDSDNNTNIIDIFIFEKYFLI